MKNPETLNFKIGVLHSVVLKAPYGSIRTMKGILIFTLFLSNSVFAHFVKTDMPFDMVAIGEDCYFKLSNNLNQFKYKKSISMVLSDNGVPQDLNGHFLMNLKIDKDVESIDIKRNGEVFVYFKKRLNEHYLSKIDLYHKDGKVNPSEACFIKQGYIFKD